MHRILIGLSTAAATLACAPAAGATGWVTTPPLSPAGRIADTPRVAVTPDGGRIVAWIQRAPNGFSGESVSVRSAPPGGSFGDLQTFPGSQDDVDLAVGDDGTAALAWVDNGQSVHIARRAPGQASFTDTTPITPSTEFAFDIEADVSGGDAFVSFSSFKQGPPALSSVWAARLGAGDNAVRLIPGTAAGSALDHVSFGAGAPSSFVGGSDLAVDGGQVTVAWAKQSDAPAGARGTTDVLIARRAPAGGAAGTFSAPVLLERLFARATSADRVVPAAAGGGGHTYVVWSRDSQQLAYQDLVNQGTTRVIPQDVRFTEELRADVDGSGALVAAWDGALAGATNRGVSAATVPPGGVAGAPTRITAARSSRHLDDLDVAADGSALVLPDHSDNVFDLAVRIDASVRPAGGTFGPSEGVSGLQDGNNFRAHESAGAIAPGGQAVAAWSANDHSGTVNQRIRVSERDSTPPALGEIAAPATATVGVRTGFAASAGDTLSQATISWDFGDGSQAEGNVVSHTFATPGPATVTITATDEAGNTTSQTRVVAVVPPPPDGSGGGGDRPGTVTDQVPPILTRVGLTNKKFRASSKNTAQVAGRARKRSPAGTVFRVTSNERTTLAVTIERKGFVRGTLVRVSGRPGAITIPFSGRIARKALPAGSYTATITAIDGAGNRSAPARVKFAVVKK